MNKWGTYSIITAIVTLVLPYILMVFGATDLSQEVIFPIISMVLGGIGVLLLLFNLIQNKTINGSGVLLMLSILAIIFGISLKNMEVALAKYILLAGVLLVAIWIMIPGKKRED